MVQVRTLYYSYKKSEYTFFINQMKKSNNCWVQATYLSNKPNKFGLRPAFVAYLRVKVGDKVFAKTLSKNKTLPEGIVHSFNLPWVSFTDITGKKHRRHIKNLKIIKSPL